MTTPHKKRTGPTGSDGTKADPNPAQTPESDDAPSYEAARDELAAVVSRLEAGGLGLDESLTLWERGEALARVCSRFLEGARQRVDTALAESEKSQA